MSSLRRPPALRISLVYLLLACLWVIFSDRLLTIYVTDPALGSLLRLMCGLLAAVASALLLYLLMSWALKARQRSESERRATEQYFSNLFDVAADAIIALDEEQRIILFNKGAEEIFGFQAEEVLGQPLDLLLPTRSIEAHRRHMGAFAAGEASSRRMAERQEIFGLRKDGTEFPAEASIAKSTRNGRLIFTVILRDITVRKQMEAAEHEQRALAEALRDTASVLNSTLDLNDLMGRILELVARVVPPHDTATVMRLENDEVVTVAHARGQQERNFSVAAERFRVADTPTFYQMSQTGRPLVISDTQTFPGWIDLPQGHWIRSYVGAPIRAGGEVVGFLNLNSAQPGTFTQVHAEQLQAFADQAGLAIQNARLFAQLKGEQAKLSAILGSTGEGIFYTEGYNIVYVNKALCRLTGYQPEELIGQPVSILHAAEADHSSPVEAGSSRRGSRVNGVWWDEAPLRRKDGSSFIAGLTIALISERGESPLRIVTVVRDITQEKQLVERQYRFITNAAHELRHPITNLITRLYLARRQPQRLEDHLGVMDQVTAHLNSMVEDMLEVSHFEQGAVEVRWSRVVLQSLVSDVLHRERAIAERKQVRLEVTLPKTPLRVWVDPVRIARLLAILIDNAISFTPAGKSVWVEVVEEPAADARYVVLYVRDEGAGIPPDELPLIFQPFHHPSEGGVMRTGLELTIARDIVTLHGGQISVTSRMGQGSTFSVRLAALGGNPASDIVNNGILLG